MTPCVLVPCLLQLQLIECWMHVSSNLMNRQINQLIGYIIRPPCLVHFCSKGCFSRLASGWAQLPLSPGAASQASQDTSYWSLNLRAGAGKDFPDSLHRGMSTWKKSLKPLLDISKRNLGTAIKLFSDQQTLECRLNYIFFSTTKACLLHWLYFFLCSVKQVGLYWKISELK